MTESTIIT